jgi:hypothetical protein
VEHSRERAAAKIAMAKGDELPSPRAFGEPSSTRKGRQAISARLGSRTANVEGAGDLRASTAAWLPMIYKSAVIIRES